MKALEFGDSSKRKLVLIHGFQMPYQIWNKYIEHYSSNFHIIVPILPGHYPNHEEDFVSFSVSAEEFENYYIPKYGADVFAVYAMSMGGVLAATLWRRDRLKIEKLIFDSSPLIPVNFLMKKMILNFYLTATHKSQKRDKKALKQAESMCPKDCFDEFLNVLDFMTDTTIQNCVKGVVDYRLPPNLDAENTRIYYFHGTTINELLAKKSAGFISKHCKNSFIKEFKGKSHCENMLFSPQIMIEELDGILI
ncbi:MAG: alpha/beta hydrolase [Clostridiales bacterium]|nr:alpha/beta hydrolase [Clostridiales bacterium]